MFCVYVVGMCMFQAREMEKRGCRSVPNRRVTHSSIQNAERLFCALLKRHNNIQHAFGKNRRHFRSTRNLGQSRDMAISQSMASFYRNRLKSHHSLLYRLSYKVRREQAVATEDVKVTAMNMYKYKGYIFTNVGRVALIFQRT